MGTYNSITMGLYISFVFLIILYTYLYSRYKKHSFLYWLLFWLLSGISYGLSTYVPFTEFNYVVGPLQIFMVAFRAYFLLGATHLSINRTVSRKYLNWTLALAFTLCSIYLGFQDPALILVIALSTAYIGIHFLLAAKRVYRAEQSGVGKTIIIFGLTAYGIHMFDFPIFIMFDLPISLGYMIALFFQHVIAFGVIIMYFDRSIEGLQNIHGIYNSIADNMDEVVFKFQLLPTLKVEYVSPSVRNVLWISQERLYKNPTLLESRVPLLLEGLEKLSSKPVSLVQFRFSFKKSSEISRKLEVKGFLQRTEKKSTLIGVLRDVTKEEFDSLSAAKQEELESIELLAGGFAHDYNNLLASIMGNISLAKLFAREDTELRQYLEDAEQECVKSRDLISKLVIFSKGEISVQEPMDLQQLIRESVKILGQEHPIELNLLAEPFSVKIDRIQILQVMHNLLINAKEASEPNKPIIISCEFTSIADIEQHIQKANYQGLLLGDYKEFDSYIKVSIQNYGEPISKEVRGKLFQPYFTTKARGTGLGLSIVYANVLNHQGLISVSSSEKIPTTFAFYLPITDEEIKQNFAPKLDLPQKPQMERASHHMNGKIALVLDDEEVVLKMIGRMLTKLGYNIHTFETGEEILEKFYELHDKGTFVDLLILDIINLKGKGGIEVMQELKNVEHPFQAIAISGYLDAHGKSEYVEAGFKELLPKPFSFHDLEDLLNKLHQH